MAAFKIKRGDNVVVIAGKDKGKRGRVLRVLPDEGRVVVEGVAMVKKHQKPVGDQAGQVAYKEAAVHVSNVALWSEGEGRAVKVGFRILEDGRKVRVDRKSGVQLD